MRTARLPCVWPATPGLSKRFGRDVPPPFRGTHASGYHGPGPVSGAPAECLFRTSHELKVALSRESQMNIGPLNGISLLAGKAAVSHNGFHPPPPFASRS